MGACWLVTGAAGFIGSHIVQNLLKGGNKVVGLDNFSTGKRENLEDVRRSVGAAWSSFTLIEGDVSVGADAARACKGVEFVSHQGALGSVPRSIEEPLATHRANVNGFLEMYLAARDAGVKRFVYASSSSVYGDSPELPKREERLGEVLSPYAASKLIDEIYAGVCARLYKLPTVGLRYFNVFGPRQDPNGAYAAVIPRWISTLMAGKQCEIYGDGKTSRDFCYVDNVVQANVLSATTSNAAALNQAYNVAVGEQMDLTELHALIVSIMKELGRANVVAAPVYKPFREGDVKHSKADISKAINLLGYKPTIKAREGMRAVVEWYLKNS
jgi:UDP-N-acetylglucosamine 4-epimerase